MVKKVLHHHTPDDYDTLVPPTPSSNISEVFTFQKIRRILALMYL